MKTFPIIAAMLIPITASLIGQTSSVSPPGRSASIDELAPPGFAIVDLGYVGDFFDRWPIGVSNELHVLMEYPGDNSRVWHPSGEYELDSTDTNVLSIHANVINRDGTIGGAVSACLDEFCLVGETRAAIWEPGQSMPIEFPSGSIDVFEGVTALASNGIIGGRHAQDIPTGGSATPGADPQWVLSGWTGDSTSGWAQKIDTYWYRSYVDRVTEVKDDQGNPTGVCYDSSWGTNSKGPHA